MIPIRDNQPSSRFPLVNWLLILANVLIFIYEISLEPSALESFVMTYGLVPAEVISQPLENWMPFITSIFLHGGWLHLIFNMLALYIFGDNIEDRLGHIPYLAFYLFGGIAGSVMHILFNTQSNLPTIGASGAIATILGAYLILYPRARVVTIIPIFIFIQVVQLPAPLYLGFWFLSQLLSGAAQITSEAYQSGGVAWWAHIGGFAAGAITALLFYRQKKRKFRPSRAYEDIISGRDDWG